MGLVSGGVATVCGDVDVPGIFVRINHPDIFQFIQSALRQTIEGPIDTKYNHRNFKFKRKKLDFNTFKTNINSQSNTKAIVITRKRPLNSIILYTSFLLLVTFTFLGLLTVNSYFSNFLVEVE